MPPESPPIRFDCPACQSSLTVLAAAVGMQGPCPRCGETIISPDPEHGSPARIPGPATPPAEPESTKTPEQPVPPVREETLQQPETKSTQGNRRKSSSPLPGVLLAAAFMLTALACFAGGFLLGKASVPTKAADAMMFENEAPAPEDTAATPSESTEEPVKIVVEEPATEGLEPEPPAALSPEQVLRAFYNASSWEERVEFVFNPEEAGPAIKKHATDFGDGPIQVESIQALEGDGPKHRFIVTTTKVPGGYPVDVIESESGPKLHWAALINFHEDQFKEFLDGPSERIGQFHLLVMPDPRETDATNFRRYILQSPIPDRATTAYVRRDSRASARLRAVFENESAKPLPEKGVPVVVNVAKKQTSEGRDYFEISDFVTEGWEGLQR